MTAPQSAFKAHTPKLSVLLGVHNESAVIAKTLPTLSFADEIVLVDDGSTDGTPDIAEKFPNTRVFREKKREDFEQNYELARQRASGEWVLFLAADEPVTPELAGEIRTAIQSDEFDGYLLKRSGPLFGVEQRDKKGWMLRLCRRNKTVYPEGRVHKSPVVSGPVGELDNPLPHYSKGLETVSQFVDTHLNQYTDLVAKDLADKGRRVTTLNAFPNLILRPAVIFVRRFFMNGGWKAGIPGLILDAGIAAATFVAWAKMWENQKVERRAGTRNGG